MAAPTSTFNTAANADASATLAAGASRTFNVDVSTKFAGWLVVEGNFGTIAATAGLRIRMFPGYASGPTYSTTNPNYEYVLTAVSGLQRTPRIMVPTGKWQFQITNLDATNGVTVVAATLDTWDAIS